MESKFDNYNVLLENYVSDYAREYGERSVKKTRSTIENSKHTRNLLNQSFTGQFLPNRGDFNSFVLSNLSFTFASTAKVKFASVVLLNHWNNEVNHKLKIASQEDIIYVLRQIITQTT